MLAVSPKIDILFHAIDADVVSGAKDEGAVKRQFDILFHAIDADVVTGAL